MHLKISASSTVEKIRLPLFSYAIKYSNNTICDLQVKFKVIPFENIPITSMPFVPLNHSAKNHIIQKDPCNSSKVFHLKDSINLPEVRKDNLF